MLARANRKIEGFFYKRGVEIPEIRTLLRNQIYLTWTGIVIALIFGLTSWAFEFIVGALLGGLNFYALAKIIQQLIFVRRGAVVALLVSFYFRLLFTGVLLYAVIVFFKANIVALLSGLSVVIVNILIFGATLVGQKFKEA
ncbi:ATP synthase subunit I [Desulfohalobiaceae bacterium Ax17]|jgi:hypothetical protein|uniref:ATP synthase subunit I n=1 Tax=Desulfovulcanus ferrireducens TaxID=2831190 RepID=UPI00207BB7C5|nr:ATP synthase subunit I [Desulfovulcanus ferrireducens]MBT8763107.1 ATP synthase subunit I [Desulfovulcanus ferrireducens]